MKRLIAILLVAAPAALAVTGVTWMRDSLFNQFHTSIHSILFQFMTGLLFCLIGLFFVAGLIYHRDRKRNKVTKRFRI